MQKRELLYSLTLTILVLSVVNVRPDTECLIKKKVSNRHSESFSSTAKKIISILVLHLFSFLFLYLKHVMLQILCYLKLF